MSMKELREKYGEAAADEIMCAIEAFSKAAVLDDTLRTWGRYETKGTFTTDDTEYEWLAKISKKYTETVIEVKVPKAYHVILQAVMDEFTEIYYRYMAHIIYENDFKYGTLPKYSSVFTSEHYDYYKRRYRDIRKDPMDHQFMYKYMGANSIVSVLYSAYATYMVNGAKLLRVFKHHKWLPYGGVSKMTEYDIANKLKKIFADYEYYGITLKFRGYFNPLYPSIPCEARGAGYQMMIKNRITIPKIGKFKLARIVTGYDFDADADFKSVNITYHKTAPDLRNPGRTRRNVVYLTVIYLTDSLDRPVVLKRTKKYKKSLLTATVPVKEA